MLTFKDKWPKGHSGHQKNDTTNLTVRNKWSIFSSALITTDWGIKTGLTNMCTCGTSKITGEHILLECPISEVQRKQIWPAPISVQEQLYGDVHQLHLITDYFRSIQVDIWEWSKNDHNFFLIVLPEVPYHAQDWFCFSKPQHKFHYFQWQYHD